MQNRVREGAVRLLEILAVAQAIVAEATVTMEAVTETVILATTYVVFVLATWSRSSMSLGVALQVVFT